MTGKDTLVQVRDVHKYFTRGSERIDVLKGVNLDIPRGDFLALMGPSGSGKTTLLNLIGGLDTPTSGSINVAGENISSLSGSALSRWRAEYRLRVPALQPAAGPHGRAQRRAAAPADQTGEGRSAEARGDCPEGRRAGRAGETLSAAAVRRTGAARRHRARDRDRPHAAAATSRPAISIARRATKFSICCRR